MKKILPVVLMCLAAHFCTLVYSRLPIDYVNPFVDTHKSRWFYFQSASRPLGMVNLSPDTWIRGSWQSGYLYDSMHIRCFSHIHAWQMAGIPVLPTTGTIKAHLGMEATKSSFSHQKEVAYPGYHKVVLDDYNITAELTSTTRVGFHRYTFPQTDSAYINFFTGAFLAHGPIDSSWVKQISPTEIAGYSLLSGTVRRPKPTYVYFVAKTNHRIKQFGGWENGQLTSTKDIIYGKDNGVYLQFTTRQEPLLMKVAISYTSIEGARSNMEAELPGWDFEQTVLDARQEWNGMLSRIMVTGGTEKQKVKFYTDLWHALHGKKIVSDADGKYCDMTGAKPTIRQIELNSKGKPVFPHYNFDALWGSHWNLNILWSIAYPELMDGLCHTMVDMYKHGGLIPRGPSGGNYTYVMIGDPAASFISCAYHKGIRNFDVEMAYAGLLKNAYPGGIRERAGYEHTNQPTGGGIGYYIERGYVPEGLPGNGYHRNGASMTLEYAYQDWCIAQLAQSLGKMEDHAHFMKRSTNFKNIWNPQSQYMHPRNKDGSWIADFQPIGEKFNTIGFCESNSAIYSHYVPHNIPALIALFGGAKNYTSVLVSSFEKSIENQFIAPHGVHARSWIDYENQPSLHMAHLFNHSGAPWLSQKWVRTVKEITFSDTTAYGGYNGDEDEGQMGALGVLMAIGLFQIDGGSGTHSTYDITSPIFDKIDIFLHQKYYPGSKFTITTGHSTSDNMYIQSATLNGESWNKNNFSHAILTQGGHLHLELGSRANEAWGF